MTDRVDKWRSIARKNAIRGAAFIIFGIAGAMGPLARRAAATTTLTVDLSASLGPVTHAASGSLYGVTETLPADVTNLIGPAAPVRVQQSPPRISSSRSATRSWSPAALPRSAARSRSGWPTG